MSAFFDAWHYDGKSAVRRKVEVQIIGTQFFLLETERRHGPFAFSDVEYVTHKDDADVYGLKGADGWRLMLSGPVPTDLNAMLPAPRNYGGWVDRLGFGKAAVAFTLASAAAVAVVLLSPQWLAPLIPSSVDEKLGDALVGDFGGRFCSTPAGDAALKKLVASLDANPDAFELCRSEELDKLFARADREPMFLTNPIFQTPISWVNTADPGRVYNVQVRFDISETGRAENFDFIQHEGYYLSYPVLSALKQSKYLPAVKQGKPVRSSGNFIQVTFCLERSVRCQERSGN
jgi:hypothetical protein